MAEENKGISVGRTNGDVHVRIAGRGTFQNGQPLRRYAVEMIGKGVRQFVVDLGACEGMDSTFLGVLAGFGMRLNPQGAPAERGIELHNATVRVRELLENRSLEIRMGAESRRIIETEFSWAKVAQDYAHLFRSSCE